MAELRGHFVPKGGEFIWMDGPVTRAMRQGARLVLNEIDLSSGDVLTYLYAVCDDPELSQVTLPTGEILRPAEGFSVVATMNGEPSYLPEALQDRFCVSLNIDKPHPEAIKRLPEDLQRLAENGVHADSNRRTSVRSLSAFADLREKLPTEDASFAVFGSRSKDVNAALKLADHDQNGVR